MTSRQAQVKFKTSGPVDAVAADGLAPAIGDSPDRRTAFDAYLELGKARLSSLVVFTTAVGYFLATAQGGFDWAQFLLTIFGTMLSAFGANAFNQCIEAERDARMRRTRNRPLPSRQLSPAQAWTFSLACGIAGPALLAACVNPLTGLLGAATLLIYVLLYTPMKTRTTLNTLVGAVCGALPPMMGWTAATERIDAAAWVLGAILFVWQIPHFLALAWMYREDYRAGGFRMLPILDQDGRRTCEAIVLYSLTLVPVTLLLSLVGATGWLYALGALLLGLGTLWLALRLYRHRSIVNARRVFLASVIYLPILLGLMIADRDGGPRGQPVVARSAVESGTLAAR